MRMAFRLSQVCKFWREVATHTSALWTSAYINYTRLETLPPATFASLVDTVVERNRSNSMALEIRDSLRLRPNEFGRLYMQNCQALSDMILRKVSSLSLIVSATFWEWLANCDQFEGNFSTLDSLSIVVAVQKLQRSFLNWSRLAPSLTRASISVRNPLTLMDMEFPWPSLLNVSYHFYLESGVGRHGGNHSRGVWHMRLALHTRLESMEVTFLVINSLNGRSSLSPINGTFPVTLANLKRFSVTNDLDGNVASLFRELALPALEDFTFEAVTPCQVTIDSSKPPSMDMYLDIGELKDSFSHLTHLILLRVCIADSDFRPIFETTISLVHLHLLNVSRCPTHEEGFEVSNGQRQPYWTPENSEILRLLTPTKYETLVSGSPVQHGEETLLPRLKLLHLHDPCCVQDIQTHAQGYAGLVSSRLVARPSSGLCDRGPPEFHLTVSFPGLFSTSRVSGVRAAMDSKLGKARSLAHFTDKLVHDLEAMPRRVCSRIEGIMDDCDADLECGDVELDFGSGY